MLMMFINVKDNPIVVLICKKLIKLMNKTLHKLALVNHVTTIKKWKEHYKLPQ